MRLLALLPVLAVIPPVAFAEPQDREALIKEEMKKFQGSWIVVKRERQYLEPGRGLSPDFALDDLLGDVIPINDDEIKEAGIAIKLDPTVNPKTADLIWTRQKDVSLKMIYSLEGDNLKVRMNSRGEERPTSFDAKPTKEAVGAMTIYLKRYSVSALAGGLKDKDETIRLTCALALTTTPQDQWGKQGADAKADALPVLIAGWWGESLRSRVVDSLESLRKSGPVAEAARSRVVESFESLR